MNRYSRSRKDAFPMLDVDAIKNPDTSNMMRVDKTISLFEEILGLVESSRIQAQKEPGFPAEPLPSLLQQCERITTQPVAELPRILIAFPGSPALEYAWWRGWAPGFDFRRLAEPGEKQDLPLSVSLVRTIQRGLAREGRELFLLATPFSLPREPVFDPKRMQLLACHPWQAYMAAGLAMGLSLDGFCEALSKHLTDLPCDGPTRYEDLGASREEQIKALLGGQKPAMATKIAGEKPTEYFGGAPVYEALCRKLGYDPFALENTDWPASPATPISLAPTQGGKALISWFLPRLNILLPPASLADAQILLAQVDAALAAESSRDALDTLWSMLDGERCALAMLLVAAHYTRMGDTLSALSFVTEATEEAPAHAHALITLAASLYLDLNRGTLALETLASRLRTSGLLRPPQITALNTAIHGSTDEKSSTEHGHALLISYLKNTPPLPDQRKRLMVEIGTTRENVPGQGSTRKLAQLCMELGLDFVTVDMDPSNTRGAQRMFKRLGLPFKAITSKGEDYLAAHPGPIDYVFLDAYDFDHGNHSEQRQSRYERYLGDRINDAGCHKMHLDCAHSLVTKLSDEGVICFDDTWTDEDGNWTAKGTTAMPFLFANGFELLEARHRAALLRRRDSL